MLNDYGNRTVAPVGWHALEPPVRFCRLGYGSRAWDRDPAPLDVEEVFTTNTAQVDVTAV